MLSNIGPGMLILIVIVALLLFGPSKLPELGRAFGRTLKEFKSGARDMMSDEDAQRKEVGPSAPAEPQRHDAPRADAPRQDESRSQPAASPDPAKDSGDNRRLPD